MTLWKFKDKKTCVKCRTNWNVDRVLLLLPAIILGWSPNNEQHFFKTIFSCLKFGAVARLLFFMVKTTVSLEMPIDIINMAIEAVEQLVEAANHPSQLILEEDDDDNTIENRQLLDDWLKELYSAKNKLTNT